MVARSEMDLTGQTAAMSMMRRPQTAKMKTGRGWVAMQQKKIWL